MNLEPDHHVFDLGDQTALVCVPASPCQKSIAAQLVALDYKVHLGLFEEDVLLKLATCNYNVVIIDENFKEAGADENVILREMVKSSGALRREHFVVLLSQRFATNDATSAFVMSVDQIINFGDLANFKPVLRRGVAMHQDLYRPFLETIKVVQAL
ncbi:MAG: hypothetical protein H0X40_15065 [Chthoniobacterales bacterium]|nr:hypothetical protein [Chthoniobacterales bacterium]